MTGGYVVTSRDQYNHWDRYHRVLAEVLDDARDGKLAPNWREELRIYALGLPGRDRDGRLRAMGADRCLMLGDECAATALADVDDEPDRMRQLYACAVLDVARGGCAMWEPYAAQGDWRRALDEWYADSIAGLDHADNIVGAEPRPEGGERRHLTAQRRDLIEAKYRAGIQAGGGSDTGWHDWFVDRVEAWRPTDLRKTMWRRVMSGSDFSAWQRLPDSWVATRP